MSLLKKRPGKGEEKQKNQDTREQRELEEARRRRRDVMVRLVQLGVEADVLLRREDV